MSATLPTTQVTGRPPGAVRPAPTGGRSAGWLHVSHALLLIGLIAGLLRLLWLGSTPVFVDEGNYTRAALDILALPWPESFWRSSQPPTLKLPLLFFLHSWLIPAVGDAVTAGRLISAVSGVGTTLLTYLLGRRLGGSRIGLLAALLYAVAPMAVLHERMVLQDGPVTAATLGTVLVAWRALEARSWRLAAAAALLGFVAVQLKVPGAALAGLALVLSLVVSGPLGSRLALAGLTAAGPVASYLLMMLSPLGAAQVRENELMVVRPLAMLGTHLSSTLDAALSYFPLGLIGFTALGAGLALVRQPRTAALFLAATLAWSLPWLVFSKFVPSRYFLPTVPYLCALAALAMVWIQERLVSRGRLAGWVGRLACAVPLFGAIAVSGWIVLDHRHAPLAELDRWQYQSGWPSGYGYREAADFVAHTAAPGSAVAYAIRSSHQIAAGMHEPLPAGVQSLGLVDPTRVPLSHPGPLYVLVDDGRADEKEAGRRARELLAREPRLKLVKRFTRPGSATGVAVLRAN